MQTPECELVKVVNTGGYTRYQHVTARGLLICMERLVSFYDGSLFLMLENSQDESEFSKRLQELHCIGTKVAEIFKRETQEVFA